MADNIDFALNDHFYDFVDDWNYKLYLLVGGYGSSKSYHVAVKLIKKLLEEKRKALVVREVFDTIRDSCYDLLQEVAEAMGVDGYLTFTSSPMQVKFRNGSRIIFKGMDKPAKLKSLNGVSIVWIEECSEVKYAGFKEILGRLRHPTLSNHIILSTNPVSKGNWCYKYFFQDKKKKVFTLDDEKLYKERTVVVGNTYYHHSTVDDNFFVPKEYVEQLDDLQTHDPDLYRVARKGRFGVNGTLVFPQFVVEPANQVEKEIKAIRTPLEKNGMDFGFVTSYNAALRMIVDHDEKILYIYREYYSRNKTDPEIADEDKNFDVKDGPWGDCGGLEKMEWMVFDPNNKNKLYVCGGAKTHRIVDFEKETLGTIMFTGEAAGECNILSFSNSGELIVVRNITTDMVYSFFLPNQISQHRQKLFMLGDVGPQFLIQ